MKVEKLTTNRAKYAFTVTTEEFEHGLDHAFEHVSKDLEVKGFRKGKVPRKVYETKFGVESLYEEALNHVFHHKYHQATADQTYQIVGQPNVDLDITSIKRGESFDFSFDVAIKPDVELGQYKGIEVKPLDDKVTDDDVKAEISRILKSKSNLEPKTEGSLEKGDTAIFDFEGFLKGVAFEGGKAENHQLEIGSNQFIPGFEEQMIGMTLGEEKDINVTFPEAYQAENLAGQEVTFKIKLHEIKTKKEAELNDEFVVSLDKENVKTVAEFEASTKAELVEKKQTEAKNHIANEALSAAITNAKVDIPKEMIEEEAKHQKEQVVNQAKQYGLEYEMFVSMNGMTVEQFEAHLNQEAERRVLSTLVIEAISKAENLEAT
ncbi:MAG: trigger factor, partial [Acholeplasmataceae bacterium]